MTDFGVLTNIPSSASVLRNKFVEATGMNNNIELQLGQPSILLLNYDCLLKIFGFLQFEDSMNLADSCGILRQVARCAFKKYSNFHVQSTMFVKGDEFLERLFTHIGQYVVSLRINCTCRYFNLSLIIDKCRNLKTLRIDYWRKDEAFPRISCLHSSDNVKVLTMDNCNAAAAMEFRKLKCFNFLNHSIEPIELKTIFQNNPEIVSFLCWFDVNYQLLLHIPNLERLCLDINSSRNISELNSLSKLNRLTKLKLYCQHTDINDFLSELAGKGILEEMELSKIEVNNHFLDILTTLNSLQLLVIVSFRSWKLASSIAWPMKLKLLRLQGFEFTYDAFNSTIRQLKYLERIDIRKCEIATNEKSCFEDVRELSLHILDSIDHSNKKPRLNLVLPDCVNSIKDAPTKYLIDSELLRIFNRCNKFDPLRICIHFPGYNDSSFL